MKYENVAHLSIRVLTENVTEYSFFPVKTKFNEAS